MRRICFIHSMVHSIDDFISYLRLEHKIAKADLGWDEENPEILFSTEHIYRNTQNWKLFKKLSTRAKVNVFYSIEAVSVDFNIFDFGITFDDSLDSSRYCQVLPPEDYFTGFISKTKNEIFTSLEAQTLLKGRNFCNFLYSNINAHPMRDRLFYEMSKYKRVDSLGRHLNNVGQKGTGYQGHSSECVGIKSHYKFSIACENATFSGYTTEKLLTSLEAHTVPIYFGNPHVSLDVNPDCFINVMDYNNLSEVIEKVREVDENDDLWCNMVSRPWYLDEHIERKETRRKNYYNMIQRILTEDLHTLKYIGEGTWPSNYRRMIYCYNVRNTFYNRIRKHLKL